MTPHVLYCPLVNLSGVIDLSGRDEAHPQGVKLAQRLTHLPGPYENLYNLGESWAMSRVHSDNLFINFHGPRQVPPIEVVIGKSLELKLGFRNQPLLGVQLSTGRRGLDMHWGKLDHLLVERHSTHIEAIPTIDLPQAHKVRDGLGLITDPRGEISKGVQHVTVVRFGLQDRLVFRNGLIQFPLLDVGQGRLQALSLVYAHNTSL